MLSLLKMLRDSELAIWVEQNELELAFGEQPPGPELIAKIKASKAELVKYLTERCIFSQQDFYTLDVMNQYAVSFAQERMLFVEKFEPGSSSNHITHIVKLRPDLNKNALIASFNQVIGRHQVLQAIYNIDEDGESYQAISNQYFSISEQNIANKNNFEQILRGDIKKTFDLTREPGIRVNHYCVGEVKYQLIVFHHIVADTWSLNLFFEELANCYNAHCNDEVADLTELKISYFDFAAWQRSELQGDKLENVFSYWQQQLSGIEPLNLSTDYPRPMHPDYGGKSQPFILDEGLSDKLRNLAKEQQTTLYVVLLSAFCLTLKAFSGQSDILIGTPTDNRNNKQIQDLIGLFVSALPIRVLITNEQTVASYIYSVHQILADAKAHEQMPFEMLVDMLDIERDTSRHPLFQIMFTLQGQHSQCPESLPFDESGMLDESLHTPAKFDLDLAVSDARDAIEGDMTFATALFNAATMASIIDCFKTILSGFVADKEQLISSVKFVSLEPSVRERKNLQTNSSSDALLHRFIEERAESCPDDIALVFNDQQVSFKQLNNRANQLANHLLTKKLATDVPVAICLERSIDMVAAMLAVLKAGAPYLPLDASLPLERLGYMLEDSEAAYLLTTTDIAPIFSSGYAPETFCMDELEFDAKSLAGNPDLPALRSSNLAYVIYTSGSTGLPKGVMIEHRSVVNFFEGLDNRFSKEHCNEVWLATTSISFDISVLELFWTLSRGSKVVIQPEKPVQVDPMGDVNFSLFYFAAEDASNSEKYKLLLEGAKYADKAGLSAVWVPERHFSSFGDQFPNPSVAAAAVAVITTNVKIRSGSVVLPLHDPIRVTEEWSMVDNLSEGRVELSFASGWHPDDFVLAPEDFHQRHTCMYEKIEQVQSLWKGEPLVRKNGVQQNIAITIHPRPVQAELPTWITAAGHIETFRSAGRIGANVLTHMLGQSKEELEAKITIYRDALEEAGFDREHGTVALMLHTFVSPNTENIQSIVEQPFKEYLRHSINLLRPLSFEEGLDLESDQDTIINIAFERYYSSSGLFGDVKSCSEKVKQFYQIGVNEIACLIDFGIDKTTTLEHLQYISQLQQQVRALAFQSRLLAKRKQTTSDLTHLLLEQNVNHLQLTPSHLHEFMLLPAADAALQQLKVLMVGGEALSEELAASVRNKLGGKLYNMYGPTEATIWASVAELNEQNVHLGLPLNNIEYFILDEQNRELPDGAVGELCIAGNCLARGYLKRPEMTAAKFISSPFAADKDHKLYRTGDLIRRSSDGILSYLGRNDFQVKIRGHRIETGEIESELKAHRGVESAVVVARENNNGKYLAAYLVETHSGEVDINQLKERLSYRLPSYMVPAAFAILPSMPLTVSGKLDRNQLPEMDFSSEKQYVPPITELEQQLCEIWEQVLEIEQVGTKDNFFQIGGNSMIAVKVTALCQKRLGLNVPLAMLFEKKNIAGLSESLSSITSSFEETVMTL